MDAFHPPTWIDAEPQPAGVPREAPSRRSVLRWAAGLPVLAAIGATAPLCAAADPSLPWREAGSAEFADPRVRALSWAILVPNPHNLQPWIAVLDGADTITLLADPSRRLPMTDPFDRQITIGFGGFLELLRMAAAAEGFEARIATLPEGEDRERLSAHPVARIRLVPGAALPDPLFAHARARRSNKASYDTARPVLQPMADALVAAARSPGRVQVLLEPARVRDLIELCGRAGTIEFLTPRTARESIDLMRFGAAAIAANPDGINVGGPMIERLLAEGRLDRARLADPASPEARRMMDTYAVPLRTAMGFVVLTTPGNDRTAQLEAGSDWLRLHLAATALGLGVHPYSQALQEFPEMRELHVDAHRMLAPGGGTVQMLARIGFGPESPAKPRWPVQAKLRSA